MSGDLGGALLFLMLLAPVPFLMAVCLVLYIIIKRRYIWILYALVYAPVLYINVWAATVVFSSPDAQGLLRFYAYYTSLFYLPLIFTIAVIVAVPIKRFIFIKDRLILKHVSISLIPTFALILFIILGFGYGRYCDYSEDNKFGEEIPYDDDFSGCAGRGLTGSGFYK